MELKNKFFPDPESLFGAVIMNNNVGKMNYHILKADDLQEMKSLFIVLQAATVNVDEVTDGKEAEDVIFETGLKKDFKLPFENLGIETLFHISGRCPLWGEALISKAVETLTIKQETEKEIFFAVLDGFVMTGQDFQNLQTFQFQTLWSTAYEIGYKPKTSFWRDFCIAEAFGGLSGVKDTFNRAFKSWKENYIFLTEFIMVLNHKALEWYRTAKRQGEGDERFLNMDEAKAFEYFKTYSELFEKADDYAVENLKGDELSYYYKTTD